MLGSCRAVQPGLFVTSAGVAGNVETTRGNCVTQSPGPGLLSTGAVLKVCAAELLEETPQVSPEPSACAASRKHSAVLMERHLRIYVSFGQPNTSKAKVRR